MTSMAVKNSSKHLEKIIAYEEQLSICYTYRKFIEIGNWAVLDIYTIETVK